jgi:hypothetical protein
LYKDLWQSLIPYTAVMLRMTVEVYLVLWRVWGTETSFGLLIGFITILHVTTVIYYAVTYLHSLQSVHSNIPILFGASDIHLETADR